MSLNWREIDLVLQELDPAGSFIQRIIQPDFTSLVLELYRPTGQYSVLISLKNARTRLHRLSKPVRKPPTRQRFAQLLHSRLKGARIDAVTHVGHDRIVRLDVSRAGVAGILWVRLWGAAANIIYAEPDGTIIDAFYRRPKRGEITGEHYWAADEQAPPPKECEIRPFNSDLGLNAAVESHYAALENEERRERLRKNARKKLGTRISTLERRLESLRRADAGAPETLQHCGELILAHLHRINTGDAHLEVDDYAAPGTTRVIELQTDLSPQQNAQHYFDLAKRQRRRNQTRQEEEQNLQAQLTVAKERLAGIDEMSEQELETLVPTEAPRDTTTEQTVGLQFSSGRFQILVGRNARENDALLRRSVRGNDLWLHTRDTPGGYVFVKAPRGKSVPLETLLDAGNLAVHFSKARANGGAELYYTQVKYLRRAKDGPRGTVLPTQEKNLRIELDEQRIARLLGR